VPGSPKCSRPVTVALRDAFQRPLSWLLNSMLYATGLETADRTANLGVIHRTARSIGIMEDFRGGDRLRRRPSIG